MANATYKQYNFICAGCNETFKKGMWYNKLEEPEGCDCPSCGVKNFEPHFEKTTSSTMFNTRGEDWTKKIPGDFKDFMGSFAKRHSKYGRTVNDHKSGKSEI